MKASTPAAEARVLVADRLSPQGVDLLVAGQTVILLADAGALVRPRTVTFWATS